jgi:hypothetical protein
MSNRKRNPAFSAFLYRCPHVERFFNKVKQFRAVATRYDKRDDNFLACAQLPSILIWLRHDKSVTWMSLSALFCDCLRVDPQLTA